MEEKVFDNSIPDQSSVNQDVAFALDHAASLPEGRVEV